MEKLNRDPKKAPGRSVLPKKQEAKTRLSIQKAEKNPNEEDTKQPKREQDQERTKRIVALQRKTATAVTDIQTAGDAKLLERRAELEEARRISQEQQENKMKDIQEIYDAKKKRINDLQQELEKRGYEYLKTFKNNDDEIDLLTQRMEEQIRIESKASREHFDQTVSVEQQEAEVSLEEVIAQYKQEMREFQDRMMVRFMERREAEEKRADDLCKEVVKEHCLYFQKLLEQNDLEFKKIREKERKKDAAMMEELQATAFGMSDRKMHMLTLPQMKKALKK